MATKKEVKSLAETIEIMSNPETMRKIANSMDDIKHGKVKVVHCVKDMLENYKLKNISTPYQNKSQILQSSPFH